MQKIVTNERVRYKLVQRIIINSILTQNNIDLNQETQRFNGSSLLSLMLLHKLEYYRRSTRLSCRVLLTHIALCEAHNSPAYALANLRNGVSQAFRWCRRTTWQKVLAETNRAVLPWSHQRKIGQPLLMGKPVQARLVAP